MTAAGFLRGGVVLAVTLSLAGCNVFGTRVTPGGAHEETQRQRIERGEPARRSTIWDLFTNVDPPNTTVEVNRYLWNAALEVLDFLPVQTVDPFSGVIVTGFGTPPGGGRAYRAAVMVTDPALDARSLNVAIMTQAGPASPATTRAVEDAILTRARQLRIRDGRL